MTASTGCVFMLATALATPPAERSVVVLEPAVEGDAPQLGPALEAGAESGVQQAGAKVVSPPEGCTDRACAVEAAGPDGLILETRASVDVSDISMETSLVAADGTVVHSTTEACDICTAEEAAGKLEATVAASIAEHAMAEEVPPEPMTTPDPGPGPVEQHTRSMSPRTAKVMEGVGWGAVGVGAAAFISGIALLVLNNRPAKNNCDAADVDAQGNCRYLWDTAAGGIGLTVSGAIVAGAGAGLVVYSRRMNGRPQSSVALSAGSIEVRF